MFDWFDLSFIILLRFIKNFSCVVQHDSFSAWNYGPGSRTMSSVPDSTYYSLVERNQQSNRNRFGQQNSQHHGAPGYPDFSHS